MPYGAPDDSNVLSPEGLQRLDDLAELAARMGSIVNYNRGGNVLMLDGFESGLNAWNLNTTGAAAAVGLSNEKAYSGTVACRVDTGTGVTPYAGLAKYLPPVGECRIGLQTCFSLNSDVVDVRLRLTYAKPGPRYYFSLMYDHVGGELKYESAPGVWTMFAKPGKVYDGSNNWHNIKLVADMATGLHVQAYLDGGGYDMAGLIPNTGVWVDGPFLFPLLRIYGDGATSGVLYLDNIIMTYNEP